MQFVVRASHGRRIVGAPNSPVQACVKWISLWAHPSVMFKCSRTWAQRIQTQDAVLMKIQETLSDGGYEAVVEPGI